MKEEVILDKDFQSSLSEAMIGWQRIKSFGLETIQWWELIVKPGIRRLAMLRGRQLNKDSKETLNLLLVRQAYLNKKVKSGNFEALGELKAVHNLIQAWYQKSCDKIKDQSRASEFQTNEKVTIYHHEVHKKLIKKSAILKLDTPHGTIEGHDKCAEYLENEVKNLLLVDAGLSLYAQEKLLEEVLPCFTDADNIALAAAPTMKDVEETVNSSNLNAASGNDGIHSRFHKECWHTMGEPLTEVMIEISKLKPLSSSQRTSLMVFGSKPKKPHNTKPQD